MSLIIDCAGDKSNMVRRKVIKILSSILEQVRNVQEQTAVLKVLLRKW